jgi:hypothetical protein
MHGYPTKFIKGFGHVYFDYHDCRFVGFQGVNGFMSYNNTI